MAGTILIDAVQRRLVENMVQKCGYEPLVTDSGDTRRPPGNRRRLVGPPQDRVDKAAIFFR